MSRSTPSSPTRLDPRALRRDFPILDQTVHGNRPLIYLDNAASSQHPQSVIAALERVYRESYANVHRGLHALSERSTADYEAARRAVQQFLSAEYPEEVIFTSGTTLAINTIARAWGDTHLAPGDEILLTLAEHHSNIVPWFQAAQRTGAVVRFADLTDDGRLDWNDFLRQLGPRTRVVAATAVSNVLGTIFPVGDIVAAAHEHGALAVIDAAQHVPHDRTDVQQWKADFVAFSGHKMLGPSGVGVLYGRRELLEAMPPFLGGGNMLQTCTPQGFTPGELPARFEAGTPPIAPAIALRAAIEYLQQVGLPAIFDHEARLAERAIRGLTALEGVRILGPSADSRAGIVSFVVRGVSPQDLSLLADQYGVAVRAGHHCAMPLHRRLGVESSCRASFYLYNTEAEVDEFVSVIERVQQRLM